MQSNIILILFELLVEDHMMASLLQELKRSRPLPPAAPSEPDEDLTFLSYLAGLMSDISRSSKLQLQGKIINMVIDHLK